MASRRLELQQSAEVAAQAAVTPAVSDVPPRRPPVPVHQSTRTLVQPVYTDNTSNVGPPPPAPRTRPAQPWLTRPLRGGRRLGFSSKSLAANTGSTSGGFHVLQDLEDDSEDSVPDPVTEHATDESSEGTDLSLSPTPDSAVPHQSLDTRTRHREATHRGKAPVLSGPTLLPKQRRERNSCARLVSRIPTERHNAIPMEPRPEVEPLRETDLFQILGIREALTPATGNCLATVVAQSVADSALDVPTKDLDLLTASIKRASNSLGRSIWRIRCHMICGSLR